MLSSEGIDVLCVSRSSWSAQNVVRAHFDFSRDHSIEVVEHEQRRRMPMGLFQPVLQLLFERWYPLFRQLGAVDREDVKPGSRIGS